jgi:WD40 repeat protein
VVALAWSPDGLQVASAGLRDIAVWDPWTGRETHRLPRFLGSRYFDLAFSADGFQLYASGGPCAVDVWDLATAERGQPLYGEEREPVADGDDAGSLGWGFPPHLIAVAHDGSWLAVADDPHPLRIIDTRSGYLIKRLPGFSQLVDDVVATDDRRLLTSSGGTVRIWDVDTWQEVASIKGPTGFVARTEDGASLISMAPQSRTLTIWSVGTQALVDEVEFERVPLALAVHGPGIWVGCDDGTVRRYEHRP